MSRFYTNIGLEHDKFPTAVYFVDEKKLIGVFKSQNEAGIYCVQRRNGRSSNRHAVSNWIRTKQRCHKNNFNKTICFRNASEEQRKLLDGRDYVILDERFELNSKPCNYQ